MSSSIVYIEIEPDENVLDYIGNYVGKYIRENKLDNADILLNYPVVYVHTWKNSNNQVCFYVGETIDLVRRTDEHEKVEEDNTWQIEWRNASCRKSFYFSSNEMNKSLSLDLEDSLIKMLSASKMIIRNGRSNEQNDYSNKTSRNGLLNEIWDILNVHHSCLPGYNEAIRVIQNTVRIKNISGGLQMYFGNMQFDLKELKQAIRNDKKVENPELFCFYPMVYMHIWRDSNKLHIYTGETNNLIIRTQQHLESTSEEWTISWTDAIKNNNACIIAIGHKEFNKSITLDIENRLIQYIVSLQRLQKNNVVLIPENSRTNEQREYSNRDKMHDIFFEVIATLNKIAEDDIFCSLDKVKKRAPFMASPLLKLNDEQEKIKTEVLDHVEDALSQNSKNHMLIVVQGGAGTGKTVLASSLFFHMLEVGMDCYFVVNHKELFNAYTVQENAWKLTKDLNTKRIHKPHGFITKGAECHIVLVDEAHLLNTQNFRRAIGCQLSQIIKKAKVTVAMFDYRQFVDGNKHWICDWSTTNLCEAFQAHIQGEDPSLTNMEIITLDLRRQMRVQCAEETEKWLDSLTCIGSKIEQFPNAGSRRMESEKAIYVTDKTGYEIGIFKTVEALKKAIKEKKKTYRRLACWRLIIGTIGPLKLYSIDFLGI